MQEFAPPFFRARYTDGFPDVPAVEHELLEKYSGEATRISLATALQFSHLFSVKTRPDIFTVFAKGYENIQRWRFVSVTGDRAWWSKEKKGEKKKRSFKELLIVEE